MEDAIGDEPAPPSSLVHVGITMGDARAYYTEMVLAEQEALFWQVRADHECNLRLLDERRSAVEHLATGTTTASDVD